MKEPRKAVTHNQRLRAAEIIMKKSKLFKMSEIAEKLNMCEPYIYSARSYPRGNGQPCPGSAVMKIIDSE
jgi:hypothetical protein